MPLYAIRKTATGYKFDVFTDDKVKLATSEVYKTVAAASTGLANYITSAEIANVSDPDEKGFKKVKFPRYEIFRDNEGKYRFRLKGTNGAILASSPAFAGKIELGKYLPDHLPKGYIIVIVYGPHGQIIIIKIKNPFPPNPRAGVIAAAKLKAYLADNIKGAFALSDRIVKTSAPVVLSPELPSDWNKVGIKPGAVKDFDINDIILPDDIKDALKEK